MIASAARLPLASVTPQVTPSVDRLWPLARPTYLTSTPPPLEHRSSCSTVHQDERGLSALIVSRARGHLALCRVPLLAQIALIDPQDCSKGDCARVWTLMMEWNKNWTEFSILLIKNWSLLFWKFWLCIFLFFSFSLCVRREVYKILLQEDGKKEREGLHFEKLRRRNNYSISDQFVLRDEFFFFVSFAITVCYATLYQSHCISIPLRDFMSWNMVNLSLLRSYQKSW